MTSSTPGETTKSAFRRPAKGYSPLLLYIFWAPALHLLGSCSTSSGLLLYIFYSCRAAQPMGLDEEHCENQEN
jgi:hypothetical protein